MSYNHFFLFSSVRVKSTNHQRALITRRAIISMWHLHPASTSSQCFVFASGAVGGEGKDFPLTVSKQVSCSRFVITNTSQFPSLHIPHSHCCSLSRSEVKAFFNSCYFFKWVEDGQKEWQTSCIGQRQMSFCVLTRVLFTVNPCLGCQVSDRKCVLRV